jgi:hypothetical protein
MLLLVPLLELPWLLLPLLLLLLLLLVVVVVVLPLLLPPPAPPLMPAPPCPPPPPPLPFRKPKPGSPSWNDDIDDVSRAGNCRIQDEEEAVSVRVSQAPFSEDCQLPTFVSYFCRSVPFVFYPACSVDGGVVAFGGRWALMPVSVGQYVNVLHRPQTRASGVDIRNSSTNGVLTCIDVAPSG